MKKPEKIQSNQKKSDTYYLNRRINGLLGLINDQFTSMIEFCLTLPLGGNDLMEQQLRKLAILHTKNSLDSALFKDLYTAPEKKLTAMEALAFVIDIHINEKIMEKEWVKIDGNEDEFTLQYSKESCTYKNHCQSLVCNGFDCVCVRRFFYEGIIKGITGETFRSKILTPKMDHEFCSFSFKKCTELPGEDEKIRSDISKTLEDNIELRNIVEVRTTQIKMQNLHLMNEIAERKKAEEQIRILSQAIEQSPVIVMITDLEANITYVNRAFEQITGYSTTEVIGQNSRIMQSGKTPPIQHQKLWQALKKGESWQGEFQNRKKNGELFWERAYIAPVLDNGGTIEHYIAVKEDISLHKQQEQEQQIAIKKIKAQDELIMTQSRHAAMGEMISMIAHQWRQPISVIAMEANNMLADIEFDEIKPEAFSRDAQMIIEQTQYLSKTIDDFRNFFRPGKQKEDAVPKEIMEECFSIMGSSLEHSNIEVIKNYQSERSLLIYSRELLQVFINIIKNAKEALTEHQSKNRKMFIEIFEDNEQDNSFLHINITDNAGGIPEEIKDNIFEPYFSTKDKQSGTGLGLYMSKTIIEEHLDGKIEINNTDNGAQFSLQLPLKGKVNE